MCEAAMWVLITITCKWALLPGMRPTRPSLLVLLLTGLENQRQSEEHTSFGGYYSFPPKIHMGADGGGRKGSAPAKAAEGWAATSLAGLPSRGNFTESNIASSMGGLKVYICLHDTAPPEGQVVKTDTNNILIRALQLSKQKNEAKDVSCKTPGESSKGKRNAARSLDARNPSKRLNTVNSAGSSTHEELPSDFSELTLQSFTVEKLRSLLKEKGLSPKGKKDELISRLREASG